MSVKTASEIAASTKQQKLVSDLLVLTRADADALDLRLQPVDLVELVQSRCLVLGSLAARRKIGFQITELQGNLETTASRLTVRADPDRLAQVIDNLLDNAIRYSPDGSTVSIRLRISGGCAHCAIQDSGPGLSPEHLPFIFERFYRADPSRSRQSGGAGLGLAIARAIVEGHGGTIHAESGLSNGATLIFTLPLEPDCLPID